MFLFIVWQDGWTFCCGRRPQHLRGHSLFAARGRHDLLYPLATAFNLPDRTLLRVVYGCYDNDLLTILTPTSRCYCCCCCCCCCLDTCYRTRSRIPRIPSELHRPPSPNNSPQIWENLSKLDIYQQISETKLTCQTGVVYASCMLWLPKHKYPCCCCCRLFELKISNISLFKWPKSRTCWI